MYRRKNDEIEEILPIFSEIGLDVSFLIPTQTAFNKGIMDATIPVRDFLTRNKLHDYETQVQGKEGKIFIPITYLFQNKVMESQASLYRPKTKKGDPRIWFYNLKKYANPYDLLGLVTDEKQIYIINLSNREILSSLLLKKSIYNHLKNIYSNTQDIANELLDKIKIIHSKGFIPTVNKGDSGIGNTLEYHLGIEANSSKNPDYKGIELKSGRRYSDTRSNLFSRVPDWENSNGMTAKKLIDKFGYWTKEDPPRFNLYCTIKARIPNPQGLYLEVDFNEEILINMSEIDDKKKYVLQWSIPLLNEALLKKHDETFWVGAESEIIDGVEHFKYNKVVHTKKPILGLFPHLIDSGVITVDYVMHLKENGSVRDHGYLFKIPKDKIHLLFGERKEYDLSKS